MVDPRIIHPQFLPGNGWTNSTFSWFMGPACPFGSPAYCFCSRSTKRKQLLLFSFYSNQAWQWWKKTFTSPFIDDFPTKIYILLGDLPLPCLMTWVYLLYPWHWGSSWRGGGPGWRELICPGVLKMFWGRWLTYMIIHNWLMNTSK